MRWHLRRNPMVQTPPMKLTPVFLIVWLPRPPSIDSLQRVQNAAARLVAGIGTRDHITPVLRSLHWLPIRLRIQYKKLCHAYAPGAHRSQSCLPGRHDDSHRWSTRSRETPFRQQFPIRNPKLKLKFGERASRTLARKAWNSLPISRN